MSETYLPVKESLGYKNVKTALLNIFQMNLDDLFILENSYEGFNFSITYRGYEVEFLKFYLTIQIIPKILFWKKFF